MIAVAATSEDGAATGLDGDQSDGALDSGAVYYFTRAGSQWSQQRYVKASNTGAGDAFSTCALSADGDMLIIGSFNEDSASTGVAANPANEGAMDSGAVYVFR